MTDKEIQQKLEQLADLCNELDKEAFRRWPKGFLFYEADGLFYLMDGDEDGSPSKRQEHIKFRSKRYAKLGTGNW